MKFINLTLLFVLFSCGNKESILLPKSDRTVVGDVLDHSSIYIFFRANAKDTLAELNKNNEIISTNWIFSIDKRLPLRLVIPEVMKLQEKKRNEVAHKNELAQNYYSYADSIGKNLAFLPFTKVVYKLEKPKGDVLVCFNKNNEVLLNNAIVKIENLQENLKKYLDALPSNRANKILFCFDKDLTYGYYIEDKVILQSLKLAVFNMNQADEEFVY